MVVFGTAQDTSIARQELRDLSYELNRLRNERRRHSNDYRVWETDIIEHAFRVVDRVRAGGRRNPLVDLRGLARNAGYPVDKQCVVPGMTPEMNVALYRLITAARHLGNCLMNLDWGIDPLPSTRVPRPTYLVRAFVSPPKFEPAPELRLNGIFRQDVIAPALGLVELAREQGRFRARSALLPPMLTSELTLLSIGPEPDDFLLNRQVQWAQAVVAMEVVEALDTRGPNLSQSSFIAPDQAIGLT